MDCKENSSHLAFCEVNLFHPRSLSMGISVGNCCSSNGNGDTNGVIVSSLQGAGGDGEKELVFFRGRLVEGCPS